MALRIDDAKELVGVDVAVIREDEWPSAWTSNRRRALTNWDGRNAVRGTLLAVEKRKSAAADGTPVSGTVAVLRLADDTEACFKPSAILGTWKELQEYQRSLFDGDRTHRATAVARALGDGVNAVAVNRRASLNVSVEAGERLVKLAAMTAAALAADDVSAARRHAEDMLDHYAPVGIVLKVVKQAQENDAEAERAAA